MPNLMYFKGPFAMSSEMLGFEVCHVKCLASAVEIVVIGSVTATYVGRKRTG